MNLAILEPGEENQPHAHAESDDTIAILEGRGSVDDITNDVTHDFGRTWSSSAPASPTRSRPTAVSRSCRAGGRCPPDFGMLRALGLLCTASSRGDPPSAPPSPAASCNSAFLVGQAAFADDLEADLRGGRGLRPQSGRPRSTWLDRHGGGRGSPGVIAVPTAADLDLPPLVSPCSFPNSYSPPGRCSPRTLFASSANRSWSSRRVPLRGRGRRRTGGHRLAASRPDPVGRGGDA